MGVSRARVNPGRFAAAVALLQVEEGAHAEDALANLAPEGDDRNLAWFLVYGVLRRQGELDAALRPWIRHPIGGMDPELRAVLRLGAFEKLHANTPDHAAVDQAVELVKALGLRRAQGIVNAVLRRVVVPEQMGRPDTLNHPAWLLERWTRRYGAEAVDRWCANNNTPPPLFVVSRGEALPPALASHAEPAGVGDAPISRLWRVHSPGGAVPDLPGFERGEFWVQDAASVAVADLLGEVDGVEVLDACAAPGGKSLRLASRGAVVTATDLSRPRLALLEQSATRLGFDIAREVHDWEQGPHPERTWGRILVDAPCSALGTVRRHPEIRWRRQPRDLAAMGVRQRRILEHASASLSPEGVLVYAVCSPEPEEGEQVVSSFLADHPDFTLDQTLHTAPSSGGEDAFHAARLVRR
ncbi:MAG: MFS transporter [Deltaproteobacteria bacterium]|nr:MFS transporter [Deltaproteobacteria bacterium]